MFCVDRVQRVVTAVVLMLVLAVFGKGFYVVGLGMIGFISIMMLIWGLFDFCPMYFILSKFLPKCDCQDSEKEENE